MHSDRALFYFFTFGLIFMTATFHQEGRLGSKPPHPYIHARAHCLMTSLYQVRKVSVYAYFEMSILSLIERFVCLFLFFVFFCLFILTVLVCGSLWYYRLSQTLEWIVGNRINLASLQGASIIQFNAGVYFRIMHFLGTRNVCSVPVNSYIDQGKL